MGEVVPLQLSAPRALETIRELASDTANIVVIPRSHGAARMAERKITHRQIVNCLRLGTIFEGPFKNGYGNWQVTLQRHAAGERMQCVVAIEWKRRLIVVTVYPN